MFGKKTGNVRVTGKNGKQRTARSACHPYVKQRTARSACHPYVMEKYQPVIRQSICTGEQVAGFKDKTTGKFEDVMLIRNPGDLDAFRQMYGINGDIPKEY